MHNFEKRTSFECRSCAFCRRKKHNLNKSFSNGDLPKVITSWFQKSLHLQWILSPSSAVIKSTGDRKSDMSIPARQQLSKALESGTDLRKTILSRIIVRLRRKFEGDLQGALLMMWPSKFRARYVQLQIRHFFLRNRTRNCANFRVLHRFLSILNSNLITALGLVKMQLRKTVIYVMSRSYQVEISIL